MRYITILLLVLTGCASNYRNATVKINHHTQQTATPGIHADYSKEDYITITSDKALWELKPDNYPFPYEVIGRGKNWEFYSARLSEYMQNNDSVTFNIKYIHR